MHMHMLREAGSLRGKVVLLRVDFNVEGTADALRLERSLPTLAALHRRGAITVIISHRGRPGGTSVPVLSLRFAVPFLEKRVTPRVFFIEHAARAHLADHIKAARPGDILLLENIRFVPEEESSRLADRLRLAHQLAAAADIYINDAFAVAHRDGASITELPRLLPSYAGLLIEKELAHLDRLLHHPPKPLVVVIAGGKAADKFEMLKNLHSHASMFLVGGVLANTFLAARGERVVTSSIDESLIMEVRRFAHDKKIITPIDFVKNSHGRILDVGPKTVALFSEHIHTARTIIWNGPLGFFEDSRYRSGTAGIASSIAHARAFSVVGGGETTQFLLEERLDAEFGFLSTGGGAMLAYLAGKKLPGLEALRRTHH